MPNFAKIGKSDAVISRFFVIFQDNCRRHLGFLKIENFNNMPLVGGQSASAGQISSKSGKRLQRYDDLTVFFQNGGLRHL